MEAWGQGRLEALEGLFQYKLNIGIEAKLTQAGFSAHIHSFDKY